jgi:leucyl aminopeptidase (aminopeptidase T)
MNAKHLLLVGGVLLAGLLPGLPARDEPKDGKGPDYESLAHNVVTRSARIAEGDLVQISGHFKDADLLEALAVHVRKQGAHPLVMVGSDRLNRRLFEDVPAKYDSQTPEFALKMAGLITAQIFIESFDEQALAGIPAERLAATAKAGVEVYPLLLKRNVRTVSLGNGLYPTASRARQFGLSESELAKLFWDGLNVDYAKMQATGEELQKILSAGREVHITNPNGTDLRVRIERRPVFVSDGVLTPEKLKKGGAACQTWLPAGEVYVAAVPDSAEGRVVIDRHYFEGREITGLTLTFQAGKLTAMAARSGGERLQALYQAAGPGKERFSVVDIGINPNLRLPEDSRVLTFMPAGMVTIGTGNDTWAGGDNNASFGVIGFLPGSTLKVDDRVIIEKGELKL